MRSRLWRNSRGMLCCLGFLVTANGALAQLTIALDPKPQFSSNSCRAYGLALAIGSLPESPFPVTTAKELRAVERDLQARISSIGGSGSGSGSHEVWKKAVHEMSSGRLELVLEYPRSYEAFYERVKALTGVIAADRLGTVMTITAGATPVMTSMTKIGGSRYADGHIVTVFGTSSQPVTPIPLAILNPAVKVADKTKLACEVDDVPNDSKWSAAVSIESVYALKPLNGGYLVMWVRKK